MERAERRRAYRVDTFATYARCSSNRRVGRYAVQNLSLGGALLHGAPGMAPGHDVEVLLRLPGSGEVLLDGRVLRSRRVAPSHAEFAVRFGEIDVDAEDAIESIVERELVRARHPVVVVAGLRRSVRRMVERAARRRGLEPLPAYTPLEMIRLLENLNVRVVAVALGTRSARIRPIEMASFLASLYPQVRRVLVGKPGWRTRRATRDLLHEYVRPPLQPERLLNAITGHAQV